MATILGDLARLIRSKNAGPFMLTFDVMFEDATTYRRVLDSGALTGDVFARLYRVPRETVMFFTHDAACAIKISIPRPTVQCDLDDGDAYGGQQHAPLVTLEISRMIVKHSRPMALLLKGIDHAETVGMVLFFSAALFIGVVQVVARYVFNFGLIWSDQAFVKFTIWAALFGASRAVRDGLHVRVDLVLDRFGPGLRRPVELAVIAINLTFCATMVWAAFGYLDFLYMIGVTNTDSGVPEWLAFLVTPLFLVFMCVRYVALIPAALASRSGDPWKTADEPAPPSPSAH